MLAIMFRKLLDYIIEYRCKKAAEYLDHLVIR